MDISSLLFLMPKKYQPDYPFLRAIPTSRIHLFTTLQLLCFVTLWLIQTSKATSILFPIMIVLLIGIWKLLDFVFTSNELKVLGDILTASKRTEILDLEELIEENIEHIDEGKNSQAHPFWRNNTEQTVDTSITKADADIDEDNIIHIKMKGLEGKINEAY